jgi:hypothetical protein
MAADVLQVGGGPRGKKLGELWVQRHLAAVVMCSQYPADQHHRVGVPITYRRYDHLWTCIGRHLPWVRTQRKGLSGSADADQGDRCLSQSSAACATSRQHIGGRTR